VTKADDPRAELEPAAGLSLDSELADDGPRGRWHANAADVSGLPMSEIVYWFALALAAAADVAAFHQVVSLILRDQGDTLVWLMVIGLTVIALTLAHFAGRLARDIRAGHGSATWKQVLACAIPWVALGLAAFTVRLIVADSSGGTTVDGNVIGGGDVGKTARQVSGAVLFLALYAGSGAVAAFGAFMSRNPLRSGYRQSLRAHNRALTRLSRSQPPYELAVQVYRQRARIRAREEANWQAARAQRLAHADELKRYAAILIAAHLQDPAATDALTLPDRRPIDGSSAAAGREARPAIEAQRGSDARPAIEARPARSVDSPQRLAPAGESTVAEGPTAGRHTAPAVAMILPAKEVPEVSDPPAGQNRERRRRAG
jgi:hypothetical protein